jgi:hypothetical protein
MATTSPSEGFTRLYEQTHSHTQHVLDVSIGTSHVIDRRSSRSQDTIRTLALKSFDDALHAPHASNPWTELQVIPLPNTRVVVVRLR